MQPFDLFLFPIIIIQRRQIQAWGLSDSKWELRAEAGKYKMETRRSNTNWGREPGARSGEQEP